VVDRNIKFESEFGKLQAIDFDRSDMVSYRIVSGNEDGCFGLDGTTGRLKVTCDLQDVRANKRHINVTATDGEYYSDVMTVRIELRDGLRNIFNQSDMMKSGIKLFSTSHSVFECQDNGVLERFNRIIEKAEENNKAEDLSFDMDDGGFARLSSKFRENSHGPEFLDFPSEISVS